MSKATILPAEWEQLGERVAQHLGLHFPPARAEDLKRGACAAARELGYPDAAGWRELLAGPLQASHLQALGRHLTIGETYFFRDRPLFDALSREVLPALIRSRRGVDKRLRIWSAGCATGEEPYSVAILLTRMLPDLADWRVTITATDINTAALEKARAGVYGEWSFRDAPPGLKETCFERRADGRYVIQPRIARLVNFDYLNLAEDVYPSADTGTHAMDVVFCRNVLMYFTPAQVCSVVGRLHAALGDGGCLAVAPSETSQALFRQFSPVNFPGAMLYCKNRPPASAQGGVARRPLAHPVRRVKAVQRAAAPTPQPPRPTQLARTLADQGRHAEALAFCDRSIAVDKLDPHVHYLRAAVLIEQGELQGARAGLLRAIFLEPAFVLAHFTLGNLARRAGRDEEAARHFANAHDLLRRYQPGDLLPEGDGLTAGSLACMLQATPPAETNT